MADPVGREGERLRTAIYRARLQLEIATGAQAYLLTTPEVETGRVNVIADCVNCGDAIPGKVRAGRCVRCWQFRRRNRGAEWRDTTTPETIQRNLSLSLDKRNEMGYS